MKIILKSIFVSLFILFVSVNLKEIAEMKGVYIVNTLDSDQVIETMTHNSKDDSYIIIFSDKDNVFYVRKVSKSFETSWETRLERAGYNKNNTKSISITVDSNNDSIFISGIFTEKDVIIFRLDNKGKIKWRTNLGKGFQIGNNNISVNSHNKSIFTIINTENKDQREMYLINLDSEIGNILKSDVESHPISYDYYQYESVVVNSKHNKVYVLEVYYNNNKGKYLRIKSIGQDFKASASFSFHDYTDTRMILNENDSSIYIGYNVLDYNLYKDNKFVILDSNLEIIKKIKFEEKRNYKLKTNLSAITIDNKDNSVVYVSTVINESKTTIEVFLNKLSPNGDVILKKQLQFDKNNIPKSIFITNDGSFLIAGNEYKTKKLSKGKGNGYFLKVDESK